MSMHYMKSLLRLTVFNEPALNLTSDHSSLNSKTFKKSLGPQHFIEEGQTQTIPLTTVAIYRDFFKCPF